MAVKKVLVVEKDKLPEKKSGVTKEWMLEWLDQFGTEEDVDWYIKTCEENPATFKSNLTNTTYDIPDLPKVRDAFLKKFFPGSYPKKPAIKKAQEKYSDRLAAIKARKAMEKDQTRLEDSTSKGKKK